MILDSSALIAILSGEPERESLLDAVAAAPRVEMSAAGYVETAIVVDRLDDPVRSRHLDELLRVLDISLADVTAEQAAVARAAYRDFGRGTGHPARLNFGDCLSYALGVVRDDTLLFKGDDFSHTNIRPAV